MQPNPEKPTFIIVTDLPPHHPDWQKALEQAKSLAAPCAKIFGFTPHIRLASLPLELQWSKNDGAESLAQVLNTEAEAGYRKAFVIPGLLDFSVFQKSAFAEIVSTVRQTHPELSVHYDDVELTHPLLVQAFVETVYQTLAGSTLNPQHIGLLLVASGHGDSASRAQSYGLMRLLWEQLSVARGEVAFLRHAKPFFPQQLARCLREPLVWLILPQMWWSGEHADYAELIFKDHCNAHPEAKTWLMVSPLENQRHLSAWLQRRIVDLWQAKRKRIEVRQPSARHGQSPKVNYIRGPKSLLSLDDLSDAAGSIPPELCYGDGLITEIYDQKGLTQLIKTHGIAGERFFVKVTWHGYATGTYTDPVALDKLLSALPGKAILMEGHTSSRNLGGADWDWETEAHQHRAWIHEQDAEYLHRTGLAEIIARHDAQYLNVTEAFWDGQCAPKAEILKILAEAGITLASPELAEYIPSVLVEHRGAPFISFARFKGPTRLAVSNMFGLIPAPLRATWHGANITHFARVCCDVAKIYGCLFRMYGLVEALNVAVRWNRKGLYRSRWGNYDLVPNPGVITLSNGLPTADALASRLQGQDVRRSAFFDVLREELGFSPNAADLPIPEDLLLRFV